MRSSVGCSNWMSGDLGSTLHVTLGKSTNLDMSQSLWLHNGDNNISLLPLSQVFFFPLGLIS